MRTIKVLTLALLMASSLTNNCTANLDSSQRTLSALGAFVAGVIAEDTAANVLHINQRLQSNPHAEKLFWKERARVSPLVPIVYSGILCAAFTALAAVFAYQAITGRSTFLGIP